MIDMIITKDHDLEDIISSLNHIRERLDGTLQAKSSTDMENTGRAEDDVRSRILEEYLSSRLQQVGEVVDEKKEVKGLRTGNGWDPNQVVEHVYKIEPIPIRRAVEVAFSSRRGLKDRLMNLLRRRKDEMKVVGTPTVEFFPIWKVKGYHECYYLRSSSYKVNVKSDVVAVEVEGKSRDLILERRHRRFIPAIVVERLHKLGSFLTSESKYFVVSDVLELATKRSESELSMSGTGRTLTEEEELALTSWKAKRIFDLSELKVRGARVQVRECTFTKEAFLAKFTEQVVRMPDRFRQILSNKLQISELKRIYTPFIRIYVQKGLVPREVIVNGSTGEVAENSIIELLR